MEKALSKFRIKNDLAREMLAEFLGTFVLMVCLKNQFERLLTKLNYTNKSILKFKIELQK